jgi:hypothetical protein
MPVTLIVKAVLGVLASLPKIISALGVFVQWVSANMDAWFEASKRKEMDRALERSKKEKNTCEQEKLFNPDKDCPPNA